MLSSVVNSRNHPPNPHYPYFAPNSFPFTLFRKTRPQTLSFHIIPKYIDLKSHRITYFQKNRGYPRVASSIPLFSTLPLRRSFTPNDCDGPLVYPAAQQEATRLPRTSVRGRFPH